MMITIQLDSKITIQLYDFLDVPTGNVITGVYSNVLYVYECIQTSWNSPY